MRFLFGLLLAAWGVVLIAWLALHWFILPHIQRWRAPIEARASEALGATVRIGTIDMKSSGWVPGVELRDVVLFDASGRPALRLPRVVAALSPRSLLAFELRFEQLLIEGADLEVRRDAAGRFSIAGFVLGGPGGAGDGDALDWFLHQREFVIRGGSVRWTDERRAAPPLVLADVQLLVRNALPGHVVRLDATPPSDWGDRFTVQGRFTQPLLARSSDWQRWSGSAYASFPRADVRELRRHVELPFELSEGNGALRGWLDLQDGQARHATVDLALREVAMRLAPDVEPLAFEQVQGRLEAHRDDDGVGFALRDFAFLTGDGIRWPRGDVTLGLRQRLGQAPTGGTLDAQRLDVGVMAQVATRLPVGEALRQVLAELKPQGQVSGLAAQWQGPLDHPDRYQVKATLTGVAVDARPAAEARELGRPGVRNATVELRATEAGGDARLAIAAGSVELPGVFADPQVPFDLLSANVAWKIEKAKPTDAEPRIAVQVRDAKFANSDAHGEFTAAWTSGEVDDKARGGRFPGRLELDGRLADARAVRVARYLPLGLPESTRRYIEGAVRGGTVRAATFKVRGHLRDFPYAHVRSAKDGEFRISAQAEDLTFAFAPEAREWPALTNLAGELVIDRQTLEVRNARAQSGAIEWSGVQGRIPTLGDNPVLGLDATARGALADLIGVVNATPIGGWIGKALATTTATGPAELKLALAVPLSAPNATTVKGSLGLAGNDVRISPDTPLLAATKGRVDFTQKGFAVVGATAHVFGGDAGFDGGTQADDSLRFTGQGIATSDGLRRATDLGPVARVATAMSGQAAYRVELGIVHGQTQIMVASNLQGMAVDLPAPLAKPAAAALELRYQTLAGDDGRAGGTPAALAGTRQTVRLDLGNVVQAHYLRDGSGDATRVLRGGIGVFGPAPTPAAGVAANLNLPQLDVDAWEAAIDKLFPVSGGSANAAPPARTGGNAGTSNAPVASARAGTSTAAPDPSASRSSGDDYIPGTVALRAQQLTSGSRRLTGVVLGATESAGLWRANVSADQLDGYVEFRPPRRRGTGDAVGAAAPGRVYARLARLSLPKTDVAQVETLLEPQQQAAATVPGLDIVVDDFELRGRHLGKVEIEAANRMRREPGQEGVREWRLTKLNVTLPEAKLTATGTWGAAPAGNAAATLPRRAALDFKLAVSNSGALLERLGAGKTILGGKGALSGQVSWLGSPLSLDYASMDGEINVAIDSGQFLKAEPGAARLLSVLSLQSLPRRLSLDFRDLFEKGFAFDGITGDVAIDDGIARTTNLRMSGPAAVVLMEGNADIAHERQDLRVVVVPEINAGTASLAVALINPAVGIGTFLAQYFLRKPLIEAGTREFHLSGSWDDPKFDRVERRRPQSVSAADAPAPAASEPRP